MRRILFGVCALAICFTLGCASDGKKITWEDVKREIRGEHIKNRGEYGD